MESKGWAEPETKNSVLIQDIPYFLTDVLFEKTWSLMVFAGLPSEIILESEWREVFSLQIYFERYHIFHVGGNRRNLLLIFFNIKSEPVFVVVVLWRDVVKNEKAMGAILFHPWDPLCGAWGAEKEVRSSLQTLSRLFSFFGGLKNCECCPGHFQTVSH